MRAAYLGLVDANASLRRSATTARSLRGTAR